MRWISHRGNITGPNPQKENTIGYINAALDVGLDVEIDVWYVNNTLYLGHDAPQEMVPSSYIHNDNLWFHCKNVEAIPYLQQFNNIKYFWHQVDDYAIVSNGKIWVYPGKPLIQNSIAVVPEVAVQGNLNECYAICTDYITRYQQYYELYNGGIS